MLRLLIITCWVLSCSVIVNEQKVRGVFGVRVSFQANSQILTFVCFIDNGRVLTSRRIVTQDEFIKIASGHWPSIYNPERKNYFEERGLMCGIAIDSFSQKESTYCVPFDSLWKLRFSIYPFRGITEDGWSSKLYRPSPKQELFLYNTYNVKNVDGDFFLDTNFWKLLSDLNDPVWIANYKSLK